MVYFQKPKPSSGARHFQSRQTSQPAGKALGRILGKVLGAVDKDVAIIKKLGLRKTENR
jgi:hypothetical protein